MGASVGAAAIDGHGMSKEWFNVKFPEANCLSNSKLIKQTEHTKSCLLNFLCNKAAGARNSTSQPCGGDENHLESY